MAKLKYYDTQPSGNWKNIYYMLQELYISTFDYDNMPDTINKRFLELALFEVGKAVFFKDDTIGFLCLKATLEGNLNVYYEPTTIRAYGGNGYQKIVKNDIDSVMIYNNYMRYTPHERIIDYAKRIWNIERTIDINIQAQKTPIMIKTSKKQELTLKNLYRQYENFEPVVILDDDIDTGKISAIRTDAPFVVDKLQEEKRKLWNEILAFIGIENNSSEKNERLTANEVLLSNGLTIANRQSRFQARKNSIDKINQMFGLNIEVKVNNISAFDINMKMQEIELQRLETGGDLIE